MTEDVVARGDDDAPRSRWGRVAGVTALLVLVAIGVGLRRHGTPDAAPTPVPTTSPIPVPRPGGSVVPAPSAGGVLGLLLSGTGAPAFVVSDPPDVYAVTAAGGPPEAEVLVGWCATSRTFQDATGTFQYTANGTPLGTGPPLRRHEVEPVDARRVRVTDEESPFSDALVGGTTSRLSLRPCPAALLAWPPPVPRARSVEEAAYGFRELTGRYVATSESFAFCPGPARGARCGAGEWITYDVPALPPGDLASEYVWEGAFALRANGRQGTFRAIRLPGGRLVRRAHVGARAVACSPVSARLAGTGARLRVTPFAAGFGPPDPDRDFTVAAGAELYLGPGYTGIGQPRATAATLVRFVRDHRADHPTLWLVLDARGAVQRVVYERPVITAQP